MYDGKTQLLVENPINRYLINSPMLPLKKNDDGSLICISRTRLPGGDKEANWLPAPDGPFYLTMRLYGRRPMRCPSCRGQRNRAAGHQVTVGFRDGSVTAAV